LKARSIRARTGVWADAADFANILICEIGDICVPQRLSLNSTINKLTKSYEQQTSKMSYYVYTIKAAPAQLEIILALLAGFHSFDSFEEKEDGLEAYLAEGIEPKEVEPALHELAERFGFSYKYESLPAKNWNEEWESAFQPVKVDDFCLLRADFHPADPSVQHDLIINPKMAFGTGHHETTYMMIKMMKDLDFTQNKVLDYGCGTGVLAILASKMGAQEIDAVDIEQPAYENTLENAQINNVFNIRAIHGDLKAVLDDGYDVILANINRNVILHSLAPLRSKMKPSSTLLISGILKQDEDLIREAIRKNGFTAVSRLEKGEWLCMKLLP
jgi:ribosomal protein L11 methyltransferase